MTRGKEESIAPRELSLESIVCDEFRVRTLVQLINRNALFSLPSDVQLCGHHEAH